MPADVNFTLSSANYQVYLMSISVAYHSFATTPVCPEVILYYSNMTIEFILSAQLKSFHYMLLVLQLVVFMTIVFPIFKNVGKQSTIFNHYLQYFVQLGRKVISFV